MHSIDNSFSYGPSKDRSRPSSLSLAWWSSLDLSSPVLTVNGYPLGQVRRCQHQQQYANPLAKCSLFRLYLRLNAHLPVERTTYAEAKSLSSNSLRDEFMAEHPGWLQTDSETFYSFTLRPPTWTTICPVFLLFSSWRWAFIHETITGSIDDRGRTECAVHFSANGAVWPAPDWLDQ